MLAFLDINAYKAAYPDVNAVGVGDYNNDGVLNNFDIDYFVHDIVCNPPECAQGYATTGSCVFAGCPTCQDCESIGPGGAGSSYYAAEQSDGTTISWVPDQESNWNHFYEVLAFLYAEVAMQECNH